MGDCDHVARRSPVSGLPMCDAHYRRTLATGDPQADVPVRRRKEPSPCEVPSCDRLCSGPLCDTHYQRLRIRGDVRPDDPIRPQWPTTCSVEGCGRPHRGKGFCRTHLGRWTRLGDPQADKPIRRKQHGQNEPFVNSEGYVIIFQGKRRVRVHRLVMERILGRPMLRHEEVHHLNGQRDDNRPENLELWSSSQPPGQRVADKVRWAKEILALYGD